jgi:hypothetical protein
MEYSFLLVQYILSKQAPQKPSKPMPPMSTRLISKPVTSDQKCQPYLPRSRKYLTHCSKYLIALYKTKNAWKMWMKKGDCIHLCARNFSFKYSFLLNIESIFRIFHLKRIKRKIPNYPQTSCGDEREKGAGMSADTDLGVTACGF